MSPSNASIRLPSKVNETVRCAVDPLAGAGGEAAHRSGQADPADLVGGRVALGEKPGPAARAVIPPLPLDAGDVAAKVVVGVQLALGRLRRRSRDDLAAVGEVGDLALATVGTGEQKRHCARPGSRRQRQTRQIGTRGKSADRGRATGPRPTMCRAHICRRRMLAPAPLPGGRVCEIHPGMPERPSPDDVRERSPRTGSSSCSRSSSTCTRSRARSWSRRSSSMACSADGAGFAGFAAGDIGQTPDNPDLIAMPDVGSFTRLPWKPEIGWFACDATVEGEAWPYCPRTILRRQLERAARGGLRVQDRLRARVLPRPPAPRTAGSRSPTRSTRSSSPATTSARSPARSTSSRDVDPARQLARLGRCTRPTTRTPTGSSSRTSTSPTRSRPATARSSTATWSRRWRRSAA